MVIVHGDILEVSYIHMGYLKVKTSLKFSLTSRKLERGSSLWRSHCSDCQGLLLWRSLLEESKGVCL